MGNLYRRHSIDVSYQVADYLAKRIQRRLKCLKLTEDRQWTPNDGKSLPGLSWQGERKSTKGHIMIYKRLHWKLKIDFHEYLQNFFFLINSLYDRGSAQGSQKLWDKWCKILHSRPLLALNFIIETSFLCTNLQSRVGTHSVMVIGL